MKCILLMRDEHSWGQALPCAGCCAVSIPLQLESPLCCWSITSPAVSRLSFQAENTETQQPRHRASLLKQDGSTKESSPGPYQTPGERTERQAQQDACASSATNRSQ